MGYLIPTNYNNQTYLERINKMTKTKYNPYEEITNQVVQAMKDHLPTRMMEDNFHSDAALIVGVTAVTAT